jgi:hypothetical protein
MWAIALALFLSAKSITLSGLLHSHACARRSRLFAYSFLWPGMDARTFCSDGAVTRPRVGEWVLVGAKTLAGVALVWGAVPFAGATRPLVTGWIGMVGIVFLLHFGFFHLLSLLWRSYGVDARPIMQLPAAATSLSRFWGGKWNAAFTDLMRDHCFKPLKRYIGARAALFLVFLISGVLHEMVISLPAHGGYGLPTMYFCTQALGLLFERSKLGRRIGLGSGWKGWCFVALVAGLTAFWLFHPVFVHNVVLPMLHAIGAMR